MNHIKQMFELQQKLNDATNGLIWTEGATKDGRQISWLRCIYMEAAEAIDSFNWKHWKDIESQPDLDNAKVELVDIWHFIMSEAIHFGDTGFAEAYENMEPEREINPELMVEILEKMVAAAAGANVDKSQNALYEITGIFFKAFLPIILCASLDGIPVPGLRYATISAVNSTPKGMSCDDAIET